MASRGFCRASSSALCRSWSQEGTFSKTMRNTLNTEQPQSRKPETHTKSIVTKLIGDHIWLLIYLDLIQNAHVTASLQVTIWKLVAQSSD